MSSRQLEQKYEEEQHQKISEVLGITLDELSQTDFEISTNESDEGLVYNLLVVFADSSSDEVLAKIEGLDENRTVRLDANTLE